MTRGDPPGADGAAPGALGPDTPVRRLPLRNRTRNALLRGGLATLGDLLACRGSQILALWSFGPASWDDLAERLQAQIPEGHPLRPALARLLATQAPPDPPAPTDPGARGRGRPRRRPPEADPRPEPDPPPAPDWATLLEQARAALGERRWRVARRRWWLDGPPRTLQDLGEELGLSRERVRQIEVQARKRLRRIPGLQAAGSQLRALVDEAGGWLPLATLRARFPLPDLPPARQDALIHLVRNAPEPPLPLTPQGLVTSRPDVPARIRQLRQACALALPAPQPRARVLAWLEGEAGLPPEAAALALDELWGASTLGEIVVCLGGRPGLADQAAAVLLQAGRPLHGRELARLHQEALPGQRTDLQTLSQAMAHDPRFMLIARGTWILRRDLDLDPADWERWAGRLLERLQEIQGVATTLALLDTLRASPRLPGWLNARSLYWLLRADPRFTTHRRLEVSAAGAGHRRQTLAQALTQALQAAEGPLQTEELVARLARTRPASLGSVTQALYQGQARGRFRRVGRGRWALGAGPPPRPEREGSGR